MRSQRSESDEKDADDEGNEGKIDDPSTKIDERASEERTGLRVRRDEGGLEWWWWFCTIWRKNVEATKCSVLL